MTNGPHVFHVLGAFMALALSPYNVHSFSSVPTGRTVPFSERERVTKPYRSAIFRRNLAASSDNESSSTTTHDGQALVRMSPTLSYAEEWAKAFVSQDFAANPAELKYYVQIVTVLRVGLPATLAAAFAWLVYPSVALTIAAMINDSDVFSVISQDSSQYIQNILTTCGLLFVLLTGNTYYFMYQQQEHIYHAFFDEVTVAKSLLEQVALVCQGRRSMYLTLLGCIDSYVKEDLMRFDVEPSVLLSARPVDDPLENIMYMTSVGEPSVVYQTVRMLRQARAHRLGAIQRKLPQIHMILLWTLACVVLCSFPVMGAGAQTIGGFGILQVQAVYISFIVFGIVLVLGVINELRTPERRSAYNIATVLTVMVQGLEDELLGRMSDTYISRLQGMSPSDDVTLPDDMEVEMLDERALSAGNVEVGGGRVRRFLVNRFRRDRDGGDEGKEAEFMI